MKTYNTRKAFSLIELLVALSILAVVAAVIVPRFLNVRTQAAATATQAQQRTIQRALQQFLSLGGTITAGTKSGDVLLFLNQAAPSVGTARPAGGSTGMTDSTGNFGSTTISLSLGSISATALTNASPVGYYAVTGADAIYSDGDGTVYDIKFSPQTGAVWFKSTSTSGSGASTIE